MHKAITRRGFIVAGLLGVMVAPQLVRGETLSVVEGFTKSASAVDPFLNGSTETIDVDGEMATLTYSYENGSRILEAVKGDEITIIVYDTNSGTLYRNGSPVSLLERSAAISALSDDGWQEVDRGTQNFSWLPGVTVYYVCTLLSPFLSILASAIMTLCGVFISSVLSMGILSMNAYAVWEHYFTIFFQQSRVRFYFLLPDGTNSNEYVWIFN